MNNPDNDFFYNLKALTETEFPKRCNNCGRVYSNAEDFIEQTQKLNGHSGLKSAQDDSDAIVLELYRNCLCGSTLMDFFSNRRDTSDAGSKRRDAFDTMLKLIEAKNVPKAQARYELRRLLNTGKSDFIASLWAY